MADSTSGNRNWNWLLWWQIDQAELDEQVEAYDRLKFWKSARGASVLCLVFSMVITVIFATTGASKDIHSSALVDAGLFAMLAAFIYFGHRWALIAAMVLWTLEKAYMLVSATGTPVLQIIWWTIYMHAFYFAFRVEQVRRKRALAIAGS